jgi:RNA polymerase sigma-70 factor, ECF subfamily
MLASWAMAFPYPQSEDTVLVGLAQDGDTCAFDELVRRYQDRVYRLTYEILRQEDDAAEALQDTFLSAYRGLGDLHAETAFPAWLYRIATNASLMKYRVQRDQEAALTPSGSPQEGVASMLPPDWLAQPPEELLTTETREVMAEGLRRLHEELRAVFVLRDIQGLTDAEAGAILKLSVSAVKARLHGSRLFLRDWLSRHFDDQAASRPSHLSFTFAQEPARPQPPVPPAHTGAEERSTDSAGRDQRPEYVELEERAPEERG